MYQLTLDNTELESAIAGWISPTRKLVTGHELNLKSSTDWEQDGYTGFV